MLVERSPRTDSDEAEALRLEQHLEAIEVDPAAAVTTGSTSRTNPEAVRAPVIDTLHEAAVVRVGS